jgi:hypothetical protein
MNSIPTPPTDAKAVDPDLAEQAVPGHGVPSQDPNLAAQVGLSPEEAERESKSVLVGGGMVVGMATGAAVGAVVAGPVGILVGGTVGAVAGVVGSNAAGDSVKPASTSRTDNAPKDAKGTHHIVKPR